MTALCFWLGTHEVTWLRLTDVPLFISRRRLATRRTLPRALGPWALDSGGFTELAMHGGWQTTPQQYVAEVRRFRDEIGNLAWAAPQDWMCEPDMVRKTGLSVAEHQRRTIANYLELRALAPDLPFIPVVQGWGVCQHECHVDQYAAAGVDLAALPLVGVGSVCRRQASLHALLIFSGLHRMGIRAHGFGLKTQGLRQHRDCIFDTALVSADSMAWSYAARRDNPLPGHTHLNCANCLEYALMWREQLPDVWLGRAAA